MTPQGYTVVWDGTKSTHRLLFADEHETKEAVMITSSSVCPQCGGFKALRRAIKCRQCYYQDGKRSSRP